MYLQFKNGFVEADCFDQATIRQMPKLHQAAIEAAAHGDNEYSDDQVQEVIVVRSREKSTISWIITQTARRPVLFASPPSWDYEWRTYLSTSEWGGVMRQIGERLDYRNFKNWTKTNSSTMRSQLAHDIWEVAHAGTVTKAYW